MTLRCRILIAAMTVTVIALPFERALARSALPPVFNLQASPATQAASYIDLKGHAHAAAAKRVAIVSFTVEFVDSLEASGAPSGNSSKKNRKKSEEDSGPPPAGVAASVAISLDPAQLQAIVDALYDLTVEDWRAAGADVLAPDSMADLPGLADIRSRLVSTPYRRSNTDPSGKRTSLVVSAHAWPAYADAGADSSAGAELAASKRTDTVLVTAHFVVDFLLLRDTDDRLFRTKLTPAYVQTVRPVATQYRVVSPDGSIAKVILRNSVRAPESPVNRGRLGDYEDQEEPDADGGADVERLAVNAAVYYDQSLRYLSATQDMMAAALGLD
jgi:hypothetical protein